MILLEMMEDYNKDKLIQEYFKELDDEEDEETEVINAEDIPDEDIESESVYLDDEDFIEESDFFEYESSDIVNETYIGNHKLWWAIKKICREYRPTRQGTSVSQMAMDLKKAISKSPMVKDCHYLFATVGILRWQITSALDQFIYLIKDNRGYQYMVAINVAKLLQAGSCPLFRKATTLYNPRTSKIPVEIADYYYNLFCSNFAEGPITMVVPKVKRKSLKIVGIHMIEHVFDPIVQKYTSDVQQKVANINRQMAAKFPDEIVASGSTNTLKYIG